MVSRLTICRKCGHRVAYVAPKCPQCGTVTPSLHFYGRRPFVIVAAAGVLLIGGFKACAINNTSTPPTEPSKIAATMPARPISPSAELRREGYSAVANYPNSSGDWVKANNGKYYKINPDHTGSGPCQVEGQMTRSFAQARDRGIPEELAQAITETIQHANWHTAMEGAHSIREKQQWLAEHQRTEGDVRTLLGFALNEITDVYASPEESADTLQKEYLSGCEDDGTKPPEIAPSRR